MEKTAMQELLEYVKNCNAMVILPDTFSKMIQDKYIQKERQQIESAYNCGKSQLDAIGDKYYFMTYIDND